MTTNPPTPPAPMLDEAMVGRVVDSVGKAFEDWFNDAGRENGDELDLRPAVIAALSGGVVGECPVCARISQLLACSVGGGVHFAVEPELSSVNVTFAKRDEAGEMSRILSDLHPLDDEGCYIHRAALAKACPPTEGAGK